MDELEKELVGMICEVCKIKGPVPDDISPEAPLIGPESPLDIDSPTPTPHPTYSPDMGPVYSVHGTTLGQFLVDQ